MLKVLISLLLVHTWQQMTILKDNISFQYLNQTSNSSAVLRGISMPRDGYSFFAISKRNDSFEDALVFMFYLSNSRQILNRYIGQKNSKFPLSKSLYTETENEIFIKFEDRNFYPLGRYLNEMTYLIRINESLFLKKFGKRFWFVGGINYNQNPKSPTDFELRYDELNAIQYDIQTPRNNYTPRLNWARVEMFHLSIYIISLLFYVFIFILLIIFSKKQPLRSRSATPYISCKFKPIQSRFCFLPTFICIFSKVFYEFRTVQISLFNR